MSEVYVQLMLELPGDRADEMSRILRGAANGTPACKDIFSHYGRLGAGVEEAIRKSAAEKPNWVDPDLTPAEALEIQTFSRRGNAVLLQFTVGDEGSSLSGWALNWRPPNRVPVGDVRNRRRGDRRSFVYSEHEDLEDDDLTSLTGRAIRPL